jgi:hypothetical protein
MSINPWRRRTYGERVQDKLREAIEELLEEGIPWETIGNNYSVLNMTIDWDNDPTRPFESRPARFSVFHGPEAQLRLPLSFDRQTTQEPKP